MKRKTGLFIGAAVILLIGYGIRDIVYEIRHSFTSEYLRTYTRALGLMMGPQFEALKLDGTDIRIGVIDAGFGEFRTNRLTRNLHVAACEDLTDGDTTGFFHDACNHGTRVTANIGGHSGDTLHGLAPNATYYLVKSDLETQEPREDEYRLCQAMERLAQQGVDVINISLGYTLFDDFDGYTTDMLDGRTALCSRFTDSLLRVYPDLVIVQSAGNEGNKKWKYINFPGDVEEILTVGACDFDGMRRSEKSGIGHTCCAIKPDLVTYDSPNGTSFSTPVVTGLCAALKQLHPLSRRELTALLHASGTRSGTPDREMGYGIPQCDSLLRLMQQD